MSDRKSWYLLAYDVREPRRLRRLHYLLCKHATALQYSLFLLEKKKSDVPELLENIRKLVNEKEDDVRLYPIKRPAEIWVSGKQSEAMSGLYGGGSDKKQGKESLIQRLLNKISLDRKSL